MRYFVNENCIGCGLCADTCPDVFKLGDEGFAVAIDSDAPDEAKDSAEEALENCPVNAIEHK